MKGILFKEGMFKAVIENRKTQTRRTGGLDMVNIDPDYEIYFDGMERDPDVCRLDKDGEAILDKWDEPKIKTIKGWYALFEGPFGDFESRYFRPKYQPGETVYLKEPYAFEEEPPHNVAYAFDESLIVRSLNLWNNKLFMPESAARYFIKITDVDVQRVQDISEKDAMAEGIEKIKQKVIGYPFGVPFNYKGVNGNYTFAKEAFQSLWESINGKESWDKNPWVWIYHFELIK